MAMDEEAKKEFAELLADGVKEGIKRLRSEDEEFEAKNQQGDNKGGQAGSGSGSGTGTGGGKSRFGVFDYLMGG